MLKRVFMMKTLQLNPFIHNFEETLLFFSTQNYLLIPTWKEEKENEIADDD